MTGIDISGVQPDDVPGNWDFVVVKLSEGHATPNHRVDAQWSNARRTARGFYHYARPALSSGADQANFFADEALARGFRPGVDIWQLDAEDGENAGVTDWRQFIIDFMGVALARLGRRGFLYAGQPFLYAHGCVDLPYKYLWWLPDYGPNTSATDHGVPAGLPVVIHQFTSFGGLDQNRIVNQMAYAQPGPVVVPPPKVKAMYSPALNISVAAALVIPELDTAFVVQPDGSMFCFGPHGVRGMNGHKDFVGRQATELVRPNPAEKAAGKVVVILDASTPKARYALPTPFVAA